MTTRRQDNKDKDEDSRKNDEPQRSLASSLANINIDENENDERKQDQASGGEPRATERRDRAFRTESHLTNPGSSSRPPHSGAAPAELSAVSRPGYDYSELTTSESKFNEGSRNYKKKSKSKSKSKSRSKSRSQSRSRNPSETSSTVEGRAPLRNPFGLSDEAFCRPPVDDRGSSSGSSTQGRRGYDPTSSEPLGDASGHTEYHGARPKILSSKKAEERDSQHTAQSEHLQLPLSEGRRIDLSSYTSNPYRREDRSSDPSEASPSELQIASGPADSFLFRPVDAEPSSGQEDSSFRHVLLDSAAAIDPGNVELQAPASLNLLHRSGTPFAGPVADESVAEEPVVDGNVAEKPVVEVNVEEAPNEANAPTPVYEYEDHEVFGRLCLSVCIYGLPDDAEERVLMDMFSLLGTIKRLTFFRRSADGNRPVNFAVCTYYRRDDAVSAHNCGALLYYKERLELCVLWPNEQYTSQETRRLIRIRSEQTPEEPSEGEPKKRAYSI